MGLEELVKSGKDKWLEATVRLSNNGLYKYAVDVVSGWMYFTPAYGLQELATGKDPETLFKSRIIALGVMAVIMRPNGLLRNHYARKWNVTEESPWYDELKVNLAATTPLQAGAYALQLTGAMAWSGNWDLESSAYAWGVGITLGAFHSFPYGHFQDKVRKFFGIKPAIAKEEQVGVPVSTEGYVAEQASPD